MTDITVTFTLPLSWLSFLTWSGFWVVYVYIGLGVLMIGMCAGIRNAISRGQRDKIMRHWRTDKRLPLFVGLLFAGWPWLIVMIARMLWRGR